jgi:hypothetical protein
MGTTLSFRRPIITRGGNKIRLYHIYEDYMHGAYESDDVWYIASWKLNGRVDDNCTTKLDLVNEWIEDLPKDAA